MTAEFIPMSGDGSESGENCQYRKTGKEIHTGDELLLQRYSLLYDLMDNIGLWSL